MKFPLLHRILSADQAELFPDPKALVSHTVTVKIPLNDVAEAFGKKDWVKDNDYLDPDPVDDFYHNGYSKRDVKDAAVKGLPEVQIVFWQEVAIALEDAERSAMASALGDSRREYLKDCLYEISIPSPIDYRWEERNPETGEYEEADIEFLGSAGVKSVELVGHEFAVEIENPEHLICKIQDARGYVPDDISPYTPSKDKDIVKEFLSSVDIFFEYFDARKPNDPDTDRYTDSGDFDSDFFKEMVIDRINALSEAEIIEKLTTAIEEEEIDGESAGELAQQFIGDAQKGLDFFEIPEVKRVFKNKIKEEKRKKLTERQGDREDT